MAGGRQMLARICPDAVINGKAAMTGAVGLQQRLKLAIHLPLRNQAELTRLLHDLYDPKSPNFHKYLSVPGFTERFGATAGDYNTVVSWAKANGLTVTARSDLPPGGGLGCSAALGVAIAKAVSPSASLERIQELAMAWERIFHGSPSGVDAAVSS